MTKQATVRIQDLPWLAEVLDTVAEFGEASLELVAWELTLPIEVLAPAWQYAISRGLMRPTQLDAETGEQMYGLTRPVPAHAAAHTPTQ